MQQYLDCDVSFDGDLAEPLTKWRQGRVTVNGNTATVWRRGEHKYDQVDRILDAKVTTSGKEVVIVGESHHLRDTVGVRGKEAMVKVHVKSHGGCSTC